MNFGWRFLFSILVIAVLLGSCNPFESTYQRTKKRELASGVQQDSLFLGFYLGMTREDFYDRGWEINKQKIAREGQGNANIEYELNEEMKAPATMNFYPRFHRDRIAVMPVKFMYKSWAPWNQRDYGPIPLEQDVLNLLEDWYGAGFFSMEHPEKGEVHVKIDGNRQIRVWKGENDVQVRFEDLTVWDDYKAAERARMQAAIRKMVEEQGAR